ncbi:MAG: hypothetical protein ABIY55_06915 [Kofleriaceae bacterium]
MPPPCSPRDPRDPQRGNSLLLALIVMSSLATLGSLTVVSVQSSLKASTNDRSQTVAMYAAESGGAAAMQFLRTGTNFHQDFGWSAFVLPNGAPRELLNTELPSSGALPGDPNNLFSPDLNAHFVIEIINNRTDDHYAQTAPANQNDHDGVVIIRATGHGPQNSVAIIEWEVQRVAPPGPQAAPPAPLLPPPPPPWPPPYKPALHIRSWHTVL